jgi:hypothetical protein
MRKRAAPRAPDLSPEIGSIADSLSSILEGRATSPTEAEVWPLYARSERAVAKLKYSLGSERPGEFTELPKSKRPEEMLREALDRLRDAAKADDDGGERTLESLRRGRTLLRAYLAELGRVRSRERRKAAVSRRTSSTSS